VCVIEIIDTSEYTEMYRPDFRKFEIPHQEVVLVCFSVETRRSFENVMKYVNLVRTSLNLEEGQPLPIILVACKCDLLYYGGGAGSETLKGQRVVPFLVVAFTAFYCNNTNYCERI
jgi:GTPase SAR1 family protein